MIGPGRYEPHDPGPRSEINICLGHGSSFDSAQDRELVERWDLGRRYRDKLERIAKRVVKIVKEGIG